MIDLSRLFFENNEKNLFPRDFSQSVSCSIFNICPENTSLATGNRKYCCAFIEYIEYFGKKNDVTVSPKFSRSIFLSLSCSFSLFLSSFDPFSSFCFPVSLPDSPASFSPKSFPVFSHSRADRSSRSSRLDNECRSAKRRAGK